MKIIKIPLLYASFSFWQHVCLHKKIQKAWTALLKVYKLYPENEERISTAKDEIFLIFNQKII